MKPIHEVVKSTKNRCTFVDRYKNIMFYTGLKKSWIITKTLTQHVQCAVVSFKNYLNRLKPLKLVIKFIKELLRLSQKCKDGIP